MVRLVNPVFQFRFVRQVAEEQQVSNLEKRAVLRQYFNGVAAILENAALSVDIGNAAAARRRIDVGRVVHHEPKVIIAGPHLTHVHRPDRPVLDGQRIGAAGAIIRNSESV